MMAARWYCVQAAHYQGWIDLVSLASLKLKEASDWAKEFAESKQVITRVIRKPHGWEPKEIVRAEPEDYMTLSRMESASEEIAEKLFLDESRAGALVDGPVSRKHEKARRRQPKTWYARILRDDPV